MSALDQTWALDLLEAVIRMMKTIGFQELCNASLADYILMPAAKKNEDVPVIAIPVVADRLYFTVIRSSSYPADNRLQLWLCLTEKAVTFAARDAEVSDDIITDIVRCMIANALKRASQTTDFDWEKLTRVLIQQLSARIFKKEITRASKSADSDVSNVAKTIIRYAQPLWNDKGGSFLSAEYETD